MTSRWRQRVLADRGAIVRVGEQSSYGDDDAMSRESALKPLGRTATVLTCAASLAILPGCSTVKSVGSFFGFGKKNTDTIEPAKTDTTTTTGKMAGSTPNDGQFVDPFAPVGGQEQPAQPVIMAANTVTPWENSPGASVFGEVSDKYMGPTSFGLQHTGADNLDQISFAHEGADFDPDISPDGRYILFASTQHAATADIYRKGVDGHTITQLTNDPANDVMPSVSPDGSRTVFASDRNGTWNIYLMNTTGGQAVQLTNDPSPQLHPSWSSDGRYIAYCRLGETSGRWELWVMEVQNPAVRHFIGYGLLPEWSPTSDKIVFQRSRQRGDRFFSIWTIDFVNGEGSNPTEIVSSPVAACVNPSFSPDGQRIAFAVVPNPDSQGPTGETPEIADLWITNIDGSGRANLTGGLFSNLMPTWGHDHRIYFISNRSGTDNIWALRPERAILAATGPSSLNSDVANKPGGMNGNTIVTVPDDNE